MSIKVVLLGTGTPNACHFAGGPCTAVCVGDRSYLVDTGPGLVRQAAKMYHSGVDALKVSGLNRAFITHLHSDHTLGLPDLIFTPWVLERTEKLQLFGPVGLRHMVEHLETAYSADIDMRINGFEKASENGYKSDITEITTDSTEIVYTDEQVRVEAIRNDHGDLSSYSYKFYIATEDGEKTILISGDTRPTDLITEKASGVDLLLHETEYTAGLSSRLPKWQTYHKEVHTTSEELGKLLNIAKPKLAVTYHRIYHMDIDNNQTDVQAEVLRREALILEEIKQNYTGDVVNGHDFDVFVL